MDRSGRSQKHEQPPQQPPPTNAIETHIQQQLLRTYGISKFNSYVPKAPSEINTLAQQSKRRLQL